MLDCNHNIMKDPYGLYKETFGFCDVCRGYVKIDICDNCWLEGQENGYKKIVELTHKQKEHYAVSLI